MPISIILDPTEVAAGRTQLDISPWIGQSIDWGDAEIETYMAQAARGSIPVDYRVPNRTVVIPLILRTNGATTFATIRNQVQQKVGIMQREGGWIKRTTSLGDVFADVVNASLKLGGHGFWEDVRGADLEAELTLECLPDWYGAEIDLGTTSTTTAAEVRKVMTSVKGNYPGRARIIVNDTQNAAQQGVIWGIRSANYTAAATAALTFEAEALTLLDASTVVTATGASGGGTNNAVRNYDLLPFSGSWIPILSTQATGGGAHMTHIGTYQVWARVQKNNVQSTKVRLVWDVGDLILPVENEAWEIPSTDQWYLAPLGIVRLYPSPIGTHRWQGQIQTMWTGSSANPVGCWVDKVWLFPVDDGYGVLQTSSASVSGLTSVAVRDGFSQTAGVLTGKALPVGGTWAGAGDADDFNVSDGVAYRASVNDTGVLTGRYALAGTTNFTGFRATLEVTQVAGATTFANTTFAGLLFRYVDSTNWAAVGRLATSSTNACLSLIYAVGSGVSYVYGSGGGANDSAFAFGSTAMIDISLTANGYYTVSVNGLVKMTGSLPILATGGTLASGRMGLLDLCNSTVWPQRNYDNLTVSTLAQDAVISANQSLEMRHDGMFREDATGTSYGPVSRMVGDLPRLPPSGLEARSVELMVKGSRGLPGGTVPDLSIDDCSVQTLYRPCWLYVPEA